MRYSNEPKGEGEYVLILEEIAAIDWWSEFPDLPRANIPAEWYYSEEYFEKEKKVFRRSWLQVARVEEIPRPGDYIVVDMDGLDGISLIVSRAPDGGLRAVHNVCSHRGNRLAVNERGNADTLTCGYHGWRFKTGGEIEHVADRESFIDLDSKCLDLARVNVDEWEGFIFVNLMPEPEQTLEEFLGPELVKGLHGYPFAQASACSYWWTMDVKANWKLVRDGFIESYHVQTVHNLTLPDAQNGPRNPNAHNIDIELYDRHSKLGIVLNPDYVPSFMGGTSYMQPPSMPKFELPPALNRTRSPYWGQDNVSVFPNFVFDPSLGALFGAYYSYNFWPLAVDRTRITHKLYFPKPNTAGQRAAQEYGKVIQREAVMEDFLILEGQQRAVASGAKRDYPMSAQEMLIIHQLHVMNREIARVTGGVQVSD